MTYLVIIWVLDDSGRTVDSVTDTVEIKKYHEIYSALEEAKEKARKERQDTVHVVIHNVVRL